MIKSKYFHPFIKWHHLLGQASTDLKKSEYKPSSKVKGIVDRHHDILYEKMVQIQKSPLHKVADIIIEMKNCQYYAIKRMVPDDTYWHIIDFTRGKNRGLSEKHLIRVRETSWRRYHEHEITQLPQQILDETNQYKQDLK